MRFICKVLSFLLIFALIFQSTHASVYAISSIEQNEANFKKIILKDENEEDVPLLEEVSDSSKVLKRLQHEEEVKVLNKSDKYTYVEYMDKESGELLQGFILANYLNEIDATHKKTSSTESNSMDQDEELEDTNDLDSGDEEIRENDDNTQSEKGDDDTNIVEPEDDRLIDDSRDKSEENDEDNDSESTDDEIGESSENQESTDQATEGADTEIIEENIIDEENKTENEEQADREDTGAEVDEQENNNSENKEVVNEPVQQFSMSLKRAEVNSANKNQKTLHGFALKSPTKVYQKTSTSAKVLKSYAQGAKLKYKTYSSGWYEASVYVNGKYVTGYINKNDVEEPKKSQTTLYGIGLKSPTKVYQKTSTGAKVLKSYAQGSKLKYNTYSSGWYEASVYVNGKYVTGYINKNDVEEPEKSQITLYGIGLKNPTKIYQKTSNGSKVLKSYPKGSMLKYKTFTSGWYEATVYVNGKYTTGYINANDVENPVKSQKILHGIGLKSPTKVYQKTSNGSKVLKSYPKGSMLKYKTFTSGWYQATVYVNGKYTTGYINANDVENPVKSQKTLHGIGLKSSTKVYQKTSTESKVLKSYNQGSILKYKTFTSDWYEATVYINGKSTTGYIHANHVEELFTTNKTEKGLASKSPTKVYSRASQSAPVLKTYSKNSTLKFETFSPNWYRATVYVNGKKRTGYIYHKDVNQNDVVIDKTNYSHNFNDVLDHQMTRSPQVWKNGTFVDASRDQVSYYLNSSNFKPNTSSYFQFLNLSSPAGINANEINSKVLHNAGTLTEMAHAFIEAGRTYNVNEIYLMAHALHETGNGKSTLAKGVTVDKNGNVVSKSKAAHTVYNMYGYGAIDSDPLNGGAKYAFNNGWFTPEAAIIGGAKDIANNYINSGQNTLYKMRWNPASPGYPQYATDVAWALAQTANISKIYDSISSYVLVHDVPVYNSQPASSGDPNKYKNTNVTLQVTATSINVRSGAGTSYGAVGGVRNGTILNAVLDKNNNVVTRPANGHIWYQIHFNGSTAWVSGGKNGTEYIKVR